MNQVSPYQPRSPSRAITRPGRRRTALPVVTALLISLLLLLAMAPAPAAAQSEVGPDRVYFPLTGHHLGGGFLTYWRANGGIPIFGYPITEELSENGQTVQYFERAVFEWHPDAPSGWKVQLRRLGADLTAGRLGEGPFQPISAESDANTTFFPQTGHRLSHGFRAYWQDNGRLRIFGYPITEEFTEGGFTVQYFERARFEWHPEFRGTPYEILLGHLGRQAADRSGVDRSPVPRADGVKDYHRNLWYVPAPPPPPPPSVNLPPGAPSGQAKWIEINLTTQYLRAWEYDRVVYGTSVSTGTWRTPTPAGTFRVYSKILSHAMSGGTPGIDYYYLPNVPHSMYFYGAYAIHGAYWHNNFGTQMSHGCVNLPLDAAAWVYNWTPIGTVVWIHY